MYSIQSPATLKGLVISFFLTILFTAGVHAQTGVIKGTVKDAITNEPLSFASVVIAGQTVGANTDDNGYYEITNLKPGFYIVEASYLGYQSFSFPEMEVTNSKPTVLDFDLSPLASELEAAVVTASPFYKTEESPLSLRTVGTTEIQRNPGGTRDISRVVQNLPGVTSTPAFRNDLIIRGGSPNENRFYLDDVEVPNINHFATQGASGGPVGLINVDFIREVNFYSGAFPSNRGNSLSSVFQFNQKNGRDDRVGATFTIGSNDLALTLEGPLSKKKNTTFMLSVRQSYLQFLFKALKLPFLPTYNDFQVKVRHKFGKRGELYFVGLGAIDQFKLNLDANQTESQRYLLGNLPISPQWNYTNGLVYKHFTDNGFFTFVLSRNMLDNKSYKYKDNNEDSLKILDYHSQEAENKFKAEHTLRKGILKINYGLNYEYANYNTNTFSRLGTFTRSYQSDFGMHKYGLFVHGSTRLLNERLALSFGFRMDGNDFSKGMSNMLEQFSPRLSASYAFSDKFFLNFNSGVYYQLPAYTVLGYKEGGQFINKDNVKYIRSIHNVFGAEYNPTQNLRITGEFYYKMYQNYPFLTRDGVSLANLGGDFGVVGNAPANSAGEGRSYGFELMAQQKLFKNFYGILAYTLGWSEFTDANGVYKPSSWDSRHIVNLVAGYTLPKNWEINARFRLQTGLPYTPFNQAFSAQIQNWDVNGRGLPDYTLLNTERIGVSHQIDVRVDKKWYFKKWSLNLYFDLRNVYGNAVGLPALVLDEDVNGEPQVNPAQPDSYLLKQITTGSGTPLPTIGVIVQF